MTKRQQDKKTKRRKDKKAKRQKDNIRIVIRDRTWADNKKFNE